MDVIARIYNRAPQDADTVVATKGRGRGSNDTQGSGPNVGAIVGGVIGAVGGLALLGIMFWWWRKRRTLSRARAKPKELVDPEMHSELPSRQPVHVPPEATQIRPFLGAAVAPIPEGLHSSTERSDASPPHYLHVTNASPTFDGEGGYLSEKKRRSTIRSTASHLSPTSNSEITSGSSEGGHDSEVARLQRQVEHLTQENDRLAMQFSPPAYEHPK
ncbi:hypothetical protein WG66_001393 [Moniliophthora roreri]|uniref:Uncharacterized protein n=1 Tax=Moniliophthora roreri TaxID=221103 RepID=A0A0W0F112_MONRR|nr:hypothetical protein WG66_001393 [Moniliophthora roreri]